MRAKFEYSADRDRVNYLTPRWITDSLGPFDMDVAASAERPWDIAKICLTGEHTGGLCGLKNPWKGYVWCNPPFAKNLGKTRLFGKWRITIMAWH